MNKVMLGLIAGIILGAAATWLALRSPSAEPPEKSAENAPERSLSSGHVRLTKEQIATADMATAELPKISYARETSAFGRVLDPSPFIALVAEVEAAQATLTATQKEFERVKALHAQDNNASTQTLEAAEAALARDRTQLASARARLLANWGRPLAEHADLDALLRALSLEETAIVRIDVFASDAPAHAPTQARAMILASSNEPEALDVLGPAPSADAQVQGAAYLALWRQSPPAPGTVLRVLLPGDASPSPAFLAPRSALVRHEGGIFVFVQVGELEFVRRRVQTADAIPTGIPVLSGIEPADRVVTRGAQQLLSAELGGGGEPD